MSTSSSNSVRTTSLDVLVADDLAEICQLVQLWLENAGHRVTAAASGRDAARLLHEQPFDLVISDVIMPEGDGLEVIAEVRRLPVPPRVLAISGGGRHLVASDCLKLAKSLGAQVVLLKPFDREELLGAVEQAMAAAPNPHSAGA